MVHPNDESEDPSLSSQDEIADESDSDGSIEDSRSAISGEDGSDPSLSSSEHDDDGDQTNCPVQAPVNLLASENCGGRGGRGRGGRGGRGRCSGRGIAAGRGQEAGCSGPQSQQTSTKYQHPPPPSLLHALTKKGSRTREPQYRVWQEVENVSTELQTGYRTYERRLNSTGTTNTLDSVQPSLGDHP